ncbi:hypothetical protein FOL47_002339 [Perkinsus chesapeaki]|uniref:Uncharacterized protein n=1 Tax=Perkinsus chesapeaki TaxID=330153 RepID=A0A7J6MEE0_PERCH|nr:hypothetical protein FOL47_002339 [Perkinsus chesapeaki]
MLRSQYIRPLLVSHIRRGAFIKGVIGKESIDATTLRNPAEIVECISAIDEPTSEICGSITLRALALLPAFTLGQCATLLLALEKAGAETDVRQFAEGVAESIFCAELPSDDSEGGWRYLEALSFSLPSSLRDNDGLSHMILACACDGSQDVSIGTVCQGLIGLIRAGILSRHAQVAVEQLELLGLRLHASASPTDVCRLVSFTVKLIRLEVGLVPERFLESSMVYITARSQQFSPEQLSSIAVAFWRLEGLLPEFIVSVSTISSLTGEIAWKCSQLRLAPTLDAIEALTNLRRFSDLGDRDRLRPVLVHLAKRAYALEPQSVIRLARVLHNISCFDEFSYDLIKRHMQQRSSDYSKQDLVELGMAEIANEG